MSMVMMDIMVFINFYIIFDCVKKEVILRNVLEIIMILLCLLFFELGLFIRIGSDLLFDPRRKEFPNKMPALRSKGWIG